MTAHLPASRPVVRLDPPFAPFIPPVDVLSHPLAVARLQDRDRALGMAEDDRRRLNTLNSSLSEAMRTISECDAIMERLHRARSERGTHHVEEPRATAARRTAASSTFARMEATAEPIHTSDSNREIIRKLVRLVARRRRP